MNMIRLHRKVDEPSAVSLLGGAERGEDHRRQRAPPQARQHLAQTQGDMNRMPRLQLRTREMRHTRLPAGCASLLGLSASALTPPAPGAQGKLELNGTLAHARHPT